MTDWNLIDEIDNKQKVINDMLIKTLSIKQIDLFAYEHESFFIVLVPKVLYYYEKGVGDVAKVWIGCRINPSEKFLFEKGIQGLALKVKDEIIPQLTLKPFKDEDAYYGMFSKKEDGAYTTITFYLNHFYPQGYWENHTL
jgi:hypothetical protein